MYRKLRFAARFLWTIVVKYRLAIVLGFTIGGLAFFLVPRVLSHITVLRPTQRIGLVGRYTLSDLPSTITSKISIGLTVLSESGIPTPGLAASFSATDSGKTYIFSINDSFKWHDGTPVTSFDIQYNFKGAHVTYPDASHLVITLPDPFAPLPSVVSRPVLKTVFFPRRYLGVGAYKIAQLSRTGSVVDSLTLTPSDPASSLPNLRYIFYPTQSQARTALKLGLLTSVVDLTDPGDLVTWTNLQVTPEVHFDRYVGVFFNLKDPLLTGSAGKNLRLALSYAINKAALSDSSRALGPLPASSWAYNPDIKPYNYDTARAKTLLASGESGPITINLSSVPAYFDIAELIKKDWEALGLTVNLQITPDLPPNFQALVVAQAIPADPDQYNFWHSTQQTTNLTGLSNPRIDKLLEDGRKTLGLDERTAIYQDFQRFLLEEAPAVFLFHPQTFSITRR